jgi:hypothetical protein
VNGTGARSVEQDWVDPIQMFRAAEGIPGCVWLDSGGELGDASRWSAILVRPVETYEARVGEGTAAGRGKGPDPFARLAHLHESWALRAGASVASRRRRSGVEVDRSTWSGSGSRRSREGSCALLG